VLWDSLNPSIEGTEILSTGEAGGTKYLREDGDGTCSWQAVAGGGSAYDYEYFQDFIDSSPPDWLFTASGTGAGWAGTTAANHPGSAKGDTGTTASGETRAGWSESSTSGAFISLSAFRLDMWIRTPLAVSDATDTYTHRFGLMDTMLAAPTDGYYFEYTHSVNAGQFVGNTDSAGVGPTAVNSSIAYAANTYYKCSVTWNGTTAEFFVDDVSIGTTTSTVNTSNDITVRDVLIKSAGTTERDRIIDAVRFQYDLTR
jgi:hypothetical protein